MSTTQPPLVQDSDSEDDADYVPSAEPDSECSDDEPESKRARTTPPKPTEEDEAAKKQAREALWASFQASVSTPPPQKSEEPLKKLIKIERRYRFAGEDVAEVVEVPEDSAEAKKWPLWRPPDQQDMDPVPETPPIPSNTAEPVPEPTPSTSSASTPKPAGKRPGPRKPRTSLASLPTPSSQKAKKISTLDKSAMDWRAHINAGQGLGLKDELEANRRSGGYLEKVEFLKRVEERKEDAIEASKSNKRRRG